LTDCLSEGRPGDQYGKYSRYGDDMYSQYGDDMYSRYGDDETIKEKTDI